MSDFSHQSITDRNGVAERILERIRDAFYALDYEWRFTYVNAQAERLIQRKREDLLGKCVWDEFPEAVGSGFDRQYRRAMAEQVAVSVEEFFPPLDTWFEVHAYPSPDGLSVFFQNINESKRQTEALRASEERYRLLVDGMKDYAVITMNADGRVTGWNAGAERIMGWSEAEVLGRSAELIFTPEDQAASVFALEMARAIVDGQTKDVRWRATKDGAPFFADGVMESLRDESGKLRGFTKVLRDVTESKRAADALHASTLALHESEARLRDAQVRLEAALTAGGIATWTWDVSTDLVVADANLARLFSVMPEEAAGGRIAAYLQAIHPDDRTRVADAIADAVANHDIYQAEYRVVLSDGTVRWLATRGKVERDASGKAVALPGVVQDITERIERERRERFLADLAERTRVLTDPDAVIADALHSVGEFLQVDRCAFVDIDIDADSYTAQPDYRANESVVTMAGTFPLSAFGEIVVAAYGAGQAVVVDDVWADRDQVPSDSILAYDAVGIRAHASVPLVHSDRLVSCIGIHSATPRHWKSEEVDLLKAVVERTWLTVAVLRQQQALGREAEERRKAYEQNAQILESVTDAFYAIDRDWRFRYVNTQAARLLHRTREELIGRNIWEEFPEAVGGNFHHLYHRAMDDGETIAVEDYYAPLDSWMDVRVYPSEAGLSVFFQNVNARKIEEQERERLRAEQEARAEREALLNRIGEALRRSENPEIAQETAVNLLGEALGADRCYVAIYDLAQGMVRIGRDWRRPDLPSIEGEYPFPNTKEMFQELYRESSTSVIVDASLSSLSARTRSNMESLQIRARVSVALADAAGLTATLTAVMSQDAREWTAEEVSLVEAVATQLRIGVEAVRIQHREHQIAVQLQEALLPDVPAQAPGIEIGNFTRAALEEASVGGDFMDVFALDKERYAIVIGDVSGKGLSAAQQLALIRNSLRTTLYLYHAPAQAATALNSIVTAHDLLIGFVTAWIGVYDAATGQITFCSCGHEPALIRRTDGTVEATVTTGPPLGVMAHTEYEERQFILGSGDSLLLYTDGVSEAGQDRRNLLGTDGLTRLLTALPLDIDVQSQAEALVTEASAFAHGAFRDDVAVLLARRK